MKITDIQIIRFAVEAEEHGTKWGYGKRGPKRTVSRGVIKIITDEGYNGFDTQYGWDGYLDIDINSLDICTFKTTRRSTGLVSINVIETEFL